MVQLKMQSSLRITLVVILATAYASYIHAFSVGPSTRVVSTQRLDTSLFVTSSRYVPEGLTAEQYERIRRKDAEKIQGKDLARVGPRGFKSRSMQAWQEAYERGEAAHTFAAVGWKEKLKMGQIKWEDVPYMIRGGSWDNSDVKGAKNRMKWNKTDREYANGGYKKEQSVSILGSGPGFDWTGTSKRDSSQKRLFPGLSKKN